MTKREDIHTCWSLMPEFSKATGENTSAGLFALGGHGGDGALRELKKRCDAERKHGGKPLVGCAMYVNLVISWVKTTLEFKERLKGTEVIVNYSADKSFRQGFERSFRLTGEDEIADIIEDTWKQYQKEESIPDNVRMDVEEDIVAILEDKYCQVGLEPHNFSPKEIELSKTLALGLGRRKGQSRTPPPPAEEEPDAVEEPAPEPPEEPGTDDDAMSENDAASMINDKLDRLGRK